MNFLPTLLISMFITMMLIPIFRTAAQRLNWVLDIPDPRKVHTAPRAKVGGIAMACGMLIPVLFWTDADRGCEAVFIGAWIIVVFGMVDDVKALGWKPKLLGQSLAAAVVVFYGDLRVCNLGTCLPQGFVLPDFVSLPLTLLIIVGVTNAINLSDGLDGLAGGISLLIFVCIGYLAFSLRSVTDSFFEVTLSAAAIGAIIGFLRFNSYPAMVFMGDTGSQLLGFLATTLSLRLTQQNPVISPVLPLLLIGFPVLDTLTVMTERIAAGRSPFKADKNHFHHKLMRLGLYHTEAVVAIYAICAFLIIAGFMLRYHSEWLLIGFYALFSGIVLIALIFMEKGNRRFSRQGFFDTRIKRKLHFFKAQAVSIKATFLMLQVFLPLLLVFMAMMPATIPRWLALGSSAAVVSILGIWILKKSWLLPILRTVYYLMVPLLAYMAIAQPSGWVETRRLGWYQLAFGLLALLTVLTLRLTRREKGFKTSPMDFLILLIALVVPNLPDPRLQGSYLGGLAAETIVLYYGFEVLAGELRNDLDKLTMTHLTVLFPVALRGLW